MSICMAWRTPSQTGSSNRWFSVSCVLVVQNGGMNTHAHNRTRATARTHPHATARNRTQPHANRTCPPARTQTYLARSPPPHQVSELGA